jgi:hypothetical protein
LRINTGTPPAEPCCIDIFHISPKIVNLEGLCGIF